MPYLNQGEFYSEFGSYDVKISLPKNYLLAATGDRINEAEEEQWLLSKVEETKPVVEAYSRIAIADGSLNMTEAAKTLQVRPIDLRRWLFPE